METLVSKLLFLNMNNNCATTLRLRIMFGTMIPGEAEEIVCRLGAITSALVVLILSTLPTPSVHSQLSPLGHQ